MAAAARAVLGLSLCLCLCLCLCQVQKAPLMMNRAIQNLLQIYKIPPKERFNGQPVFSRELLATKMEAKDVLMSAVLRTYEELLAHMIRMSPAPTAGGSVAEGEADPSPDLSYLLKRVQDLRKYRYQEPDRLLEGLRKIQQVQLDNLVVQSKALWELPSLYSDASSLADSARAGRLRRRRANVKARRART